MSNLDQQGTSDVLQYFHEQVRLHPQRTAIICGGDHLTFLELEYYSNRLANLMRSRGVLPGEPVALLLNKDIRTLGCMLAIWKLGALYVPIDPAAPAQKMKSIFDVCNMRRVVLDSGLNTDFGKNYPEINAIDINAVSFEEYSAVFSCEPIHQQQLAYMIFTSGSTGVPKGVAISRESLSFFISWCRNSLDISGEMVALNMADFSFDQSVMDIAFLIGSGVTLHVYSGHKDPISIAGYIQRNAINVLSTVPTIFGLLFDEQFELSAESFASLRKVFIGGAACPAPYVQAFHRMMPTADVYNMYGPTEVTVYCMFHRFSREELSHGVSAVELGKPLPGHEVWLVDDDGNETSSRGELVVSGPQVMVGYWGSTEQTSMVLRESRAGRRGYHTGDIVQRSDGNRYTFTGRKNETIKSAGYRIDLGEIEAALMSCPNVMHAAAVAVPHTLMENAIHVFISQGGRGILDENAVRDHCSTVIPNYMQPHQVHFLPKLPLNASGKIDKKRLVNEVEAL
ncbi:amino acid adenylation domain-containing protein [Pseudomonas sp. H3(2019)]|uniref:amino acid adenylation domain-containing protein n=1 Tax=Pseudomonas sp. H3(2019) TaxID=2598724 RepID=UPI001192F7B0|nr:amino acid adenylation domain-containing protein [Pseudomonas sp. H3(2019)]TVT86089.1 amino acid adenylation domain-containing protein [Pseudomonas sp. H3(2019)]